MRHLGYLVSSVTMVTSLLMQAGFTMGGGGALKVGLQPVQQREISRDLGAVLIQIF